MIESIDILVDTREQQSWTFQDITKSIKVNLIKKGLKTGDYTILGYESQFTIERKKSVSELASNCSEPRFKRELQRLLGYKYKYIVCEFSLWHISNWDQYSKTLSYNHSRITSQYLMRYLSDIQVEFDLPIIFAGDRHSAQHYSLNLMRRVQEKQHKQKS
jgi:ERCC4-type nuclease